MKISKWYVIVIAILVTIIVSVITINISFHRTLQMEMAEQFNKQQLLLARAEATNIQAYIEKIKDDMLRISQFLSLIQFNNETLYEFLTDLFFKDVRKVKIGISFLDSKGKILFNQGDLVIEKSHNTDLVEMAINY